MILSCVLVYLNSLNVSPQGLLGLIPWLAFLLHLSSCLCLFHLHGWLSLVWGLHLPDGSARFLGQIPSPTQVLSTCFPQVSARWWKLFLTLLASFVFHSCLSLFVRVEWFCLYKNLLFLNQKPESTYSTCQEAALDGQLVIERHSKHEWNQIANQFKPIYIL